MKTVSQLAFNLNLKHNQINQVIRQQRIICDISMPKRRINEWQEEIIQQILYFEGKIDGFIYESKMHEIPEQESWEIFKAKTYGRK